MKQVNVKDRGAIGDGKHDDTKAVADAIAYAFKSGIKTVYFPVGDYLIGSDGTGDKNGIIPLKNGVSLIGAGQYASKIILSGGRHNPHGIFYQQWWNEPSIDNLIVRGITFDGNIQNQTFHSEIGALGADYQYCHALSIANGNNPQIFGCKFQNFRGDGLVFGDTFQKQYPGPNLRITRNVTVNNCEFVNIYREGILFCCTDYAKVYNNYFHGDGFGVAGVDIERHSAMEQVTNVSVYKNKFDFYDGFGPIERGGKPARFRRAISMGFFYDGYTNNVADGKASGHLIYDNVISQGQIDCWGHTFSRIYGNSIIASPEDLTDVHYISSNLIKVAAPAQGIKGLDGISVTNNKLVSKMNDVPVLFEGYNNCMATGNNILSPLKRTIELVNGTGVMEPNVYSLG